MIPTSFGKIGTRDSGLGTGEKRSHAGTLPQSPVPNPQFRLSGGFTLIEVLAAIALVAIAFAIALSAFGGAAHNAARSAALDTAVERARTLLAEQGLTAPLKNETLSGKFDDGMGWTLDIHALPAPAAPSTGTGDSAPLPQGGAMMAQAAGIDLYQLDIAVQYRGGRTLRLSTQRAQAASTAGNGE